MSIDAAGVWVDRWLSTPRFARYVTAAGGDRGRALALYEWNVTLGSALLRDIGHLEVGLRNHYNQTMVDRWGGTRHWLADQASPVIAPLRRRSHGQVVDINARNRDNIADATTRAGGTSGSPDKIVAELSFGFWRHLTDAGHEQCLWVPYLHHAWPRGTARTRIDRVVASITATRNRAAHHEPLFACLPGRTDAPGVHGAVMTLLGLLGHELGEYVRDTSTVPTVWAARP